VKIAFRLDAGNDIGMGHAVRCSVLVDEFIAQGHECTYFSASNPEIELFVREYGIELIPVPDIPIDEEMLWIQKQFGKFDVVILDSYRLSSEYIASLHRENIVVCAIDDNALYEYSCDIVLNQNLFANELQFRIGLKLPYFLLGGEYCLLRKEFQSLSPIQIQEYASRIFICFGGSDMNNFTPVAVEALQNLPGVELFVVLGPASLNVDEVRNIMCDNVHLFVNPAEISTIMKQCDIAIISAGSIVYEVASIGLPSIVTVQADNQRGLAAYLKRNALMEYIQNSDDITTTLRQSTSSLLSNYQRRTSENLILQKTVARNGGKKVVDTILRLSHENTI
jgi:UDP-2,4-diacetamido-2,4,6-trideoxy-beta-L-altropyranose hydrolase